MTRRPDHHRTAITPELDSGMAIPEVDGQCKPQARKQRYETKNNPTLIADALMELLDRTDGWLRIVPDGEHKCVFFKWKFHRGPHAGHYVMSVVEWYQIAYGLQLIALKVAQVDEGSLKPTKDIPHS